VEQIFLIIASVVAVISLGGIIFLIYRSNQQRSMQNLMQTSQMGDVARAREQLAGDVTGKEEAKLNKKIRRSRRRNANDIPIEERLYQAGIFSSEARKEFDRLRILCPLGGAVILGVLAAILIPELTIVAAVAGGAAGYCLPSMILDHRIKERSEDIMYYLPLVIEEIAIGVSSSLDIGPCLQRVIAMADERGSHNVVTELVSHAYYYLKSGVSLEESLIEVGNRSGHPEVKHVFTALSQVAKHGGEITRQLQELADAVASKRETEIDAKIKKLELKATGPLALVFLGFLIILFSGFAVQLMDSFSNMGLGGDTEVPSM
jgi:Flp pilus assembly protein TadB